jgi:hypothetical protein
MPPQIDLRGRRSKKRSSGGDLPPPPSPSPCCGLLRDGVAVDAPPPGVAPISARGHRVAGVAPTEETSEEDGHKGVPVQAPRSPHQVPERQAGVTVVVGLKMEEAPAASHCSMHKQCASVSTHTQARI